MGGAFISGYDLVRFLKVWYDLLCEDGSGNGWAVEGGKKIEN